MSSEGFWSCPVCGRLFRNKNQWHSHEVYPVEHHFMGKPLRLKQIFDYLARKIGEFGPVRIDAVKTGVNFAARSHFAMAAVQKKSIKLELILGRGPAQPAGHPHPKAHTPKGEVKTVPRRLCPRDQIRGQKGH